MINRRGFVASAAIAATGSRAFAQAERSIVLGQSAAFSGPAQQLGMFYNQGAKLYFDALNAKGGINGRAIELLRLDDGYEPDRCAANTKKFIDDGVFALFGYVGTPTSLAAVPLAVAAKMPFFAPYTGAEALRTPANPYIVNLRASYFDETAAMVKQLTSVGVNNIAVCYQNDSYGQAGLEGVVRALAPLNLKPSVVATVERNSLEVEKAVATILAGKPQAIVQIGAYKACAKFIRLARQAGFSGNFYNISFVGTQALLDELGPLARGVVVSQVMPYPYAPVTPIAAEYLAAIKASGANGASPSYSAIEGYVAAKVFVEAVRRAGRGLTRESFLAAAQAIQAWNIGGMTIDLGPQKASGAKFVEMTILTEDGKIRR